MVHAHLEFANRSFLATQLPYWGITTLLGPITLYSTQLLQFNKSILSTVSNHLEKKTGSKQKRKQGRRETGNIEAQ